MNTTTIHDMAGNPFCTRHVLPGRLPSFDASGRPVNLDEVLARLAAIGGSAAIVGRHGSGKTTLLWQLADALEAEGRRVVRVRLRHTRDIGRLLEAVARVRRGGVVCVDSWERLGPLSSLAVTWCARVMSAGLIVTAHRTGPLPTLWESITTPAVLGAVVHQLAHPAGMPAVIEGDVDEAFREASGNIREALFLLYDRFEDRARLVRPVCKAAS